MSNHPLQPVDYLVSIIIVSDYDGYSIRINNFQNVNSPRSILTAERGSDSPVGTVLLNSAPIRRLPVR